MFTRVLIVLSLVLPLRAAVDPATFQDLHWRLIGPFRGGRVLAVTGVSGQPDHFYFGSVNGGVWETRDAGRTWQPKGEPVRVQVHDFPSMSIGKAVPYSTRQGTAPLEIPRVDWRRVGYSGPPTMGVD